MPVGDSVVNALVDTCPLAIALKRIRSSNVVGEKAHGSFYENRTIYNIAIDETDYLTNVDNGCKR